MNSTLPLRLLSMANSELGEIQSDIENVRTCFSSDDADGSYVLSKLDEAIVAIGFAYCHVQKMIEEQKLKEKRGHVLVAKEEEK